jgi:hypothetical protein
MGKREKGKRKKGLRETGLGKKGFWEREKKGTGLRAKRDWVKG